jgi:hypothetical protein
MSDKIHVGTRKGLFTIVRDGSGGWDVARSAFLSDNVPMVLADFRTDTIFAALAHSHFGGKLHRSTDGGTTWEEVNTPAYPERPEGTEPDRDAFGREIPWNLKLIWELTAGGADQPDVLWCGTLPGGLFKSTDRGTSWHLVTSLWEDPRRKEWFGGGYDYPGIHSITVDPRDSNRVVLGVSCGGVWETLNGGDSWDLRADGLWAEYMPPDRRDDPTIQDPHRVVRCAAEPDAMWTQHHNGVFRTTDAAASWREIKDVPPSNFGFAVAVHPTDPDTAWFVPAVDDESRIPVDGQVVVSRTTDGGASFDVLREGLPQHHAYDLVFRHALDVDMTGERLVFGSTTGSLWVSEDSGDSWITVATHLPPIYCTRFVEP